MYPTPNSFYQVDFWGELNAAPKNPGCTKKYNSVLKLFLSIEFQKLINVAMIRHFFKNQ